MNIETEFREKESDKIYNEMKEHFEALKARTALIEANVTSEGRIIFDFFRVWLKNPSLDTMLEGDYQSSFTKESIECLKWISSLPEDMAISIWLTQKNDVIGYSKILADITIGYNVYENRSVSGIYKLLNQDKWFDTDLESEWKKMQFKNLFVDDEETGNEVLELTSKTILTKSDEFLRELENKYNDLFKQEERRIRSRWEEVEQNAN